MASKWREHAVTNDAVEASSGSWKRRIAFALEKTQGSGSWSRRIAGSQADGSGSLDRAAEKVLSDD